MKQFRVELVSRKNKHDLRVGALSQSHLWGQTRTYRIDQKSIWLKASSVARDTERCFTFSGCSDSCANTQKPIDRGDIAIFFNSPKYDSSCSLTSTDLITDFAQEPALYALNLSTYTLYSSILSYGPEYFMDILLDEEWHFGYFRSQCWLNVFIGNNLSTPPKSRNTSECITAEWRDGESCDDRGTDTSLTLILYIVIYL